MAYSYVQCMEVHPRLYFFGLMLVSEASALI